MESLLKESARKIKVIIADQQPLFRKGIHFFLSEAPDIVICAQAGTEAELVAVAVREIPDVVLLDISLASEGMDLARMVKQHVPTAAVIVIAPAPNDEGLFMAIKARAAGYVSRNIASEELISIIRRAARGEYPLNDTFLSQPKVAAQVLEQFRDFSWGKGVETFVSPLTPRERPRYSITWPRATSTNRSPICWISASRLLKITLPPYCASSTPTHARRR